ncbi:glycosyltransferase [Aquihabitans sp. G128]|uniref:glycosyltransferase n=1 Tax=Aquihabitans sp. G128 TaxID=2849779 RepID=UPI001C212361|nr:glycosyltransferase [Aquihabitans sp. G128]QXC62826.1 glycosyltransferase [Aquihabitans sp. G128]
MTAPASAAPPVAALAHRLRAVAEVLEVEVPAPAADPAVDAATLLPALVVVVRAHATPAEVWLLHVALTGSFPGTSAMAEALRAFELEAADDLELWLARAWRATAHDHRSGIATLQVVTDGVVLDVSNTAKLDLHTGIQRVIRSAAPHWLACGPAVPVAWTDGWQAYRTLAPAERHRVFSWDAHQAGVAAAEVLDVAVDAPTLVVPWRSTVLLAESLEAGSCDVLAALAIHSGNDLAAIGYDLIPATSGDLVPAALSDQFMNYLSVVKHTHRIAGISASAAAEFEGYAAMLASQGLPGPAVGVCALPAPPMPEAAALVPRGRPRVLVVGSYEPRKNHLAVLFAAERLWQEGLDFELHLVGGSSWVPAIGREVERLAGLGRPVERHLAVSEAELAAQYATARFTVLVSLHEGYGLPIVESLAAGTPALVSDFGSIAEIAADGGCRSVDPRDDAAILDAMRTLLTDDAELAVLQREIVARPAATWADYARASWRLLVGTEPLPAEVPA